MIVSPGSGNRGVTDTMSALRDPMTRIRGGMMDKVFQFGSWIVDPGAGYVFGSGWGRGKFRGV